MKDKGHTPTTRLFLARSLVQRQGGATVAQLMTELEASRVTVMRYLRDLPKSGTPITSEWRGQVKAYFVPQKARSATIPMTGFEMVAVAVAKQIARYLEGTPFYEGLEQVIKKIEASLQNRDLGANLERKIFDVNEGAMLFRARDGENLDILVDALINDEQLLVRHEKVDKGRKAFAVDPYTLLFHRKGPYLVGRSHHPGHRKEPIRKFAFDGIRSLAREKGKTFVYPRDYRPERLLRHAFGIMDDPPELIRIRFRKKVERWVRRRRWHRTQKIGPVVDGWFEVRMKCAPSGEVLTWVLGWGANAEILEPTKLREEAAAELKAASTLYQKSL